MVLYGNFSILGLLVLKHHNRRPKSTDFSVYKFIQAVIRFLWDAHNVDESPDEDEYSVSSNYLPYWNDLIDLWYLGMQVLSSLLSQVNQLASLVWNTFLKIFFFSFHGFLNSLLSRDGHKKSS